MPADTPVKSLRLRGLDLGVAPVPATSEVRITGSRRVQPGGASRDASAPVVTVGSDQLVRVEYENGIRLWMRADDLLRERGSVSASRGAGEPEVWDIDTAPRAGVMGDGATARGLVGIGIKVLEFFGVEIAKTVAAGAAGRFEVRQLKGNAPGLYRAPLAAGKKLEPIETERQLPGHTPLLIFLHGTMSSYRGSFGDLENDAAGEAGTPAREARQALRTAYGDNVYAFEHLTLTQSPIRNALDLVNRLPPDTELHLVSHSRGGLVGELLCLAERERSNDPLATGALDELFDTDRTIAPQLGLLPLSDAEKAARNAAYTEDAATLRALLQALDAKRVRVRRFVRVACPARGTTLASGRLDRWLSVIDLLAGNSLFGEAADFLLTVLKQRTDPRTMPGVESMMPGSALTRLLQLPLLVTSADLSVIAGDVEGDSLWAKMKLLAADWFYSAEHDLVVNTGSMSGGLRRPDGGARWLEDRGPQVNHFRYFANPISLRWLVSGLTRADGASGGFSPYEAAVTEEPRWRSAVQRSRGSDTPRPIVVVIPGTMGSALDVGDSHVWLNYWALLRGGLADVGWGAAGVKPVDLIGSFYGPLLEHLAREHRVEVFPYDWRRSVRDSAQELAKLLATLLPDAERTGKPLHIVAHSMGGLVSRTMIADGADGTAIWQRMGRLPGGSRLLMLGTPNRGSHEAVRWLTGANPTEAKLTLLDLRHGVNGIIDIVRRFPGMAELLPFDADAKPLANVDTWKKLKASLGANFPLIEQRVLDDAGTSWALLTQAAVDAERMRYVAGSQRATVVGYQLAPDDGIPGPRRLDWIATPEGDGTVSWASGRLEQVPMYFAEDTAHDELCANAEDRRVFRGYVDLLATGRTDQLATTPPLRARGADGQAATFVLPRLPVADSIPDEAAVQSLGFSGLRRRRRGKAVVAPTIQISVRHADLAYARHAVLVGHYEGDTIVSAEAALDRRLGDALTHRRDLGLYPGARDTHAVFCNADADGSPEGAVVVGLGTVGELSAGQLQSSVRDAMLEYALRKAQDAERADAAPGVRVAARLSCLLVGSGGAGLQVRESVEAILRAAIGANRRLEDTHLDGRVLIDEIEFIEIFEDVAIGAARAIANALQSTEIGDSAAWAPPTVSEGPGRRKRRFFDSDRSWDQRIEIVEDDDSGMLRFSVATNRARAEETLATGQLELADLFVSQAGAGVIANTELSRTLFELLLPPGFKETAPDQRDMVLLLDARSARFPWELLEDRWSRNGQPVAIEAGIVRQFKTREFRARPSQALADTALVIGNPDLSGSTDFGDLPGARAEAAAVRDLLRRYYPATNVVDLIDPQAADIVAALHQRPWRVLHLAGHGEHEYRRTPQSRPMSGMVIGNGVFLTPGDVAQMRCVPELVFVNCCHLGKTEAGPDRRNPPFARLAANLGVQFIEMGVRAVVCAGWAVDDAAALTFARAFYDALFTGHSFRDAVKAARRAAHHDHPDRNTWGAYQCYGDPAWRLVRDGRGGVGSGDPEYVSMTELIADLENLAESARVQSRREGVADDSVAARQAAAVERLRQRVPAAVREAWMARADVAAGVGFAFAEASMFQDAIDWLEKALQARDGDCPVRAAEQSANMRVRLAAEEAAMLRLQADPSAEAQAAVADRIEATIRELDYINARAATPERLKLLGGACKRLAWVRRATPPRVEALLNMAQYYRSALDLLGGDDAYALANWALACLLLERLAPEYAHGDWHPALEQMLAREAERTGALQAVEPNFWNAVSLGDLALVQLLMAADDATEVARLAEAAARHYSAGLARGASLREAGTVREHLEFMVDLCTRLPDADARSRWPAAITQALGALRSKV